MPLNSFIRGFNRTNPAKWALLALHLLLNDVGKLIQSKNRVFSRLLTHERVTNRYALSQSNAKYYLEQPIIESINEISKALLPIEELEKSLID
jgi:hypothetical protein